jgi:hypothetical protein
MELSLNGGKVQIARKKDLHNGAHLMKRQNTSNLPPKSSALLEQLRKDSVTITDKIETVEYGKFVHIMDIEGNKIELWEPNDIEFDKLGKKINAATIK